MLILRNNWIVPAFYLFLYQASFAQQKIQNMNIDPHSFAAPHQVVIIHIDLDLDVNFKEKQLEGRANYRLSKHENNAVLTLDVKDIDVFGVYSGNNQLSYSLSDPQPFLGSALQVVLPENMDSISIDYRTTPASAALQWLDPEQTLGKKHPFLFTQSQAILARTWIPLQDSPGVRFTYSAKIRVPKGMMALMSAQNPRAVSQDGTYNFKMNQPVPSYLMALAAGHLNYEALGAQTGLYAEPELLNKAAWEFAETENMLLAAEALYGPYRWEVYDLLVLPPSFPFGGMENPRLTFATPTILAGDRSLTSLVAHELAHSWSGNLVTNATWDDFWLNEGFTVYFERRIMESLYGAEYADMLATLGYQDLISTIDTMMAEGKEIDTHLKLNLAGRDPDDGMNDVAYEKGYFFLRVIENWVGRAKFDAFVASWFSENAFQSRTTEDFLQYLNKVLLTQSDFEILKIKEWVYGPGLPDNLPIPKGIKFQKIDRAVADWVNRKNLSEADTAGWSSHEWLYFVRSITSKIQAADLATLDLQFGFTQTGNSEIKAAWLLAVVKYKYEKAYPELHNFLKSVGRRKFIVPLYKSMKQNGLETMALQVYEEARSGYHAVAVETLDKMLR
jgi:aminopeptidase N